MRVGEVVEGKQVEDEKVEDEKAKARRIRKVLVLESADQKAGDVRGMALVMKQLAESHGIIEEAPGQQRVFVVIEGETQPGDYHVWRVNQIYDHLVRLQERPRLRRTG